MVLYPDQLKVDDVIGGFGRVLALADFHHPLCGPNKACIYHPACKSRVIVQFEGQPDVQVMPNSMELSVERPENPARDLVLYVEGDRPEKPPAEPKFRPDIQERY